MTIIYNDQGTLFLHYHADGNPEAITNTTILGRHDKIHELGLTNLEKARFSKLHSEQQNAPNVDLSSSLARAAAAASSRAAESRPGGAGFFKKPLYWHFKRSSPIGL